ncbi:hypothetical protein E2C01_069801 [Portunus trituberculatus]|uniref:Uncharacterized protein n=1 Tax=Portunus trituberculatus TaxID=210409 RepID=A0A5B7I3R6_PORTR|nr:hypothetical protein [Portunus trituberculatus]
MKEQVMTMARLPSRRQLACGFQIMAVRRVSGREEGGNGKLFPSQPPRPRLKGVKQLTGNKSSVILSWRQMVDP